MLQYTPENWNRALRANFQLKKYFGVHQAELKVEKPQLKHS